MVRRKGVRNKGTVKGKGAKKKSNSNVVDKNRASPHPLWVLAKNLTDDQKAAVVGMHQGPFLNISCNELHNPLVSWFVRTYVPDRRAFVIPCRGVIPLSEESVGLMSGLSRGSIEVEYEVDCELEEEISSRLFPGLGSRPKVTDVGLAISKYKLADKTFKELWMIYITSTVLAPTRDNRISNKCYTMLKNIDRAEELNMCKFVADQLHENLSKGKYGRGCLLYCMLRCITAINTDDLELELEEAEFPINSWTNLARDVVAALDAQELDSTKFGALQLRDEFKDVLSREMGLFGGPDGFEAWFNLNLHPTCTSEQRKRAYSLMLNFASTMNNALINLMQGLTQSVPCERCADAEAEAEVEADDPNDDNNGSDADDESSEDDKDEETETDADHVVEPQRVCRGRKGRDVAKSPASKPSSRGGNVVSNNAVGGSASKKNAVASSSGTHAHHDGVSSSLSPPPIHSQIFVPSDTELFGSDGAGYIGGIMNDSPSTASQHVDDQIRGTAARLVANLSRSKKVQNTVFSESELNASNAIKLVVARELQIPLRGLPLSQGGEDDSHDAIPVNPVSDAASVDKNVAGTGLDQQVNSDSAVVLETTKLASTIVDAPKYNPLHKRKRHGSSNLSPSRKSPRFAKGDSALNIVATPVASSGAKKNGSKGPDTVSEADGTSAKTAFVVSPTVSNTPKASVNDGSSARSAVVISPTARDTPKASISDGKTARTAVVISPTVTDTKNASVYPSKLQSLNEGRNIASAIPISPVVPEAEPADGNQNANTCRAIVISPQAQQVNDDGRGTSTRPSTGTPNIGAQLRRILSSRGSPKPVTPQLASIVKSISDSFNRKELEIARTVGKHPMPEGVSSRKRKAAAGRGPSPTKKIRDNRPGMFTPPVFNLMSSQDTSSTDDEPIDAIPVSWMPSQEEVSDASGNVSSDGGLEEFKMSKELENFLLHGADELSVEAQQELIRYEELTVKFAARRAAMAAHAQPDPSQGGHSVTPKVNPQKARVRKPSRFKSSPYDGSFTVSADQEEVYKLFMLHSSYHRDGKSNLKTFRIVDYDNSFVFTGDLADSIQARGELSASCMEVGIEYLQKINTIKGKKIMPYILSKYLMENELKSIVIAHFKRTTEYSLSVFKRIQFPVLEEIVPGQAFGNHWYCLSLNLEAGRFEALDSLRGENNIGLISHANGLVKRIKVLWETYYSTSKIQIKDYDLKIIDAPKQVGNKACGYHTLYNIENWDGQNIPQISKDDVIRMRKVLPYRWASVLFNKTREWRWHLENNKSERV